MRALPFILVLAILASGGAFAEGSRELNSSTHVHAYRVLLTYNPTNWYKYTANDSVRSFSRMFIFARAGDSICLASSALGVRHTTAEALLNGGRIRLHDPTGLLVLDTANPGPLNEGLIAAGAGSKARENEGPFGLNNGGVGGYRPVVHVALMTGLYQIHFTSPDPSSSSAEYGTTVPLASANFVQTTGARNVIGAWDASIIRNGQLVTGRLFATFLTLSAGRLNFGSNPRRYSRHRYTLRILTRDGYRYNVTTYGMAPYGYNIFADNAGMVEGDSQSPSYASTNCCSAANYPTDKRIHKPEDGDEGRYSNHKMFFNNPDATMPELATSNGSSTWLNPPLVDPNTSVDLFFTLSGGANPFEGNFSFEYPYPGNNYVIQIDGNNNGVFDEPEDITVHGVTIRGTNTVAWSGLDANGDDYIPNGAGCLNAKITILSGEIHIGLTDVELNAGGYEIVRLNGIKAVPDYTIYFNDLPLNDNTNIDPGYIKATGPSGINSAGGVHRWERPETVLTEGYTGTPTHTSDYGNDRFMDHWAYDSSLNKIFTPLTCFTVLSLRFGEIKAQRVPGAATLQWHFNSNGSAGMFEIERATHGSAFKRIGLISAQGTIPVYQFTDSLAPQQQAFYRIRARFGSQTMVSGIIQLAASDLVHTAWKIWPNPAYETLFITIPDQAMQPIKLEIVNAQGQRLLQRHLTGSGQHQLQIGHFPKGIYSVLLSVNHQLQPLQRFVKQ